jgi:hypothetical protein
MYTLKLSLYNHYTCAHVYTNIHTHTHIHTHTPLCSRLDPNLWVQALTYFASQEPEECKSKIQEVLEHIDEHHLMPPLMVVQTLSESKCATLSDIKVKDFSSVTSLFTVLVQCSRLVL